MSMGTQFDQKRFITESGCSPMEPYISEPSTESEPREDRSFSPVNSDDFNRLHRKRPKSIARLRNQLPPAKKICLELIKLINTFCE